MLCALTSWRLELPPLMLNPPAAEIIPLARMLPMVVMPCVSMLVILVPLLYVTSMDLKMVTLSAYDIERKTI